MSAFNIVEVAWNDIRTGKPSNLRIQFKFGDTWQYVYRIGDPLRWGGNDIGPHGAKYVVVDGALEGEPPEGLGEDFEVHIKDGVIERVIPATGMYDFVNSDNAYIVLTP